MYRHEATNAIFSLAFESGQNMVTRLPKTTPQLPTITGKGECYRTQPRTVIAGSTGAAPIHHAGSHVFGQRLHTGASALRFPESPLVRGGVSLPHQSLQT